MSFEEWNESLDEVDGFSAWEQTLTAPVLDTVEDVDKESENILQFADELETPIPIIEDYYNEILHESPIADPKDVSLPFKAGRIGLREQIQRMDAVDWLKRAPISIWGAVDTADLALTSKRLQKNQYETIGDLKKKVSEAQETARFAEPIYDEDIRLTAGLPEWDKGLPDETLSSVGEQTRLRDIQRMEKFLLEQHELAERGQTFFAKVFDGVSYLPGWMIEFFLTGGLSKLGNETARQIVITTLRGYTKTKAGQIILRASGWTGGAITRASLGLSHRVMEQTFQHRIPKQMHFGPDGNLIIDIEPDSWATSILKGWGDTVIEAASEEAGATITKGLGAIVKKMPFGSQVMNRLEDAWTAIKPENTKTLFAKRVFTRAGYSNIVGEIGEERLATVLRAITDVDDFGLGESANMFDRLAEGLTQDIKNLPVEAVVLSLPAGAQYAVGRLAQNEQLPPFQPAVAPVAPVVAERPAEGIKVPAKAELEALSYKELQQQAKELGIKANQKKEVLIEQIVEAQPEVELPLPEFGDEAVADLENVAEKGKSGLSIERTITPTGLVLDSGEVIESGKLIPSEISGRRAVVFRDENGKAIGTLSFEVDENEKLITDPELGALVQVFVVPEQRRKGIATKMFDFAKKQGFDLDKVEGRTFTIEGAALQRERLTRPAAEAVTIESVREELINEGKVPTNKNIANRLREKGIDVETDKFGKPILPAEAVTIEVLPIPQGEVQQMQSETEAIEALGASEQYLNESESTDLIPQEPTEEQVGAIRNFFHKIGVKDKSGYEPLADKDFVDFFKFLQMPEDIRRTFPQFDPVYQVQRAREVQKANLDNTFAEMTRSYFELSDKERKKVDAALFEADRNPAQTFGPKALDELGLDQKQQKAFHSIRDGLDTSKNLLIDRMKEFGVKKETIEEFEAKLENYIPHKWYGNWAVVAQETFVEKEKPPTKKRAGEVARAFLAGEPIPEPEKVKRELKRPRTIFMTATSFKDRFTERERVKKLYPDTNVIILKRNKVPREAFQEAPPFAVQRMLDLAIEKAEASAEVKASMQEALSGLFKSKGFGMHFIKRKDIPGYTEDLKRPLAEYFVGFSGYISKMEAIKAFPDAMKEIHPQRTPNLYKYALDYIKYVTGDQREFANAKRGMYFYYLFGNIKSASLNMTQNITLGWPVLSKHTNFALPKLLQAMARTAVPKLLTKNEKEFIKDLEKAGYLQPQLSQEISGISGNPIVQQVKGKAGKLLSMADVFRMMETFNRHSMAVALYDAKIRDVKQAGEFIDEAHFHYAKGNRPVLARGYVSPIMVFRSWNINYMLWLKNQIKTKQVPAFARSISALVFFGGVAALPGWEVLKFMWRKIFGTDPEAEARDAMGQFWGQVVMKGAPTSIGISFTGSVGMADILPTDLKSIGGVFADIPSRIGKVSKDIKSKQYRRALEDASPEFLRNPLASYRLYKDGALSRGGRTILDLETGRPLKISGLDATKKALGFQPAKLAEQWDLSETLDFFTTERLQKKQNWADRYWLGFLNKDLDQMEEVVNEMIRYNKKQISRDRQPITMDEMDSMLQIRARPINIPPSFMLPALQEIREKFFKGKK